MTGRQSIYAGLSIGKCRELFAARQQLDECGWINASSICNINLSFCLSLSLSLLLSQFVARVTLLVLGAVLIKSQPIIH